jgi:hypothetical protein
VAAVIRIDALWLAIEPIDMRAGAERLLARVASSPADMHSKLTEKLCRYC